MGNGVEWTPEMELWMLDAMEHYPPWGSNSKSNLESIASFIKKKTGKLVSVDALQSHVDEFYDMKELPDYDAEVPKKKKEKKKKGPKKKAKSPVQTDSEEEKTSEGEKVVIKKEKLEATYESVKRKRNPGKYQNLTEVVYSAIKDSDGGADLSEIYDYTEKNWTHLDKKLAEKYDKKDKERRNSIRTLLKENPVFEKQGSNWMISEEKVKKEKDDKDKDDKKKKKRRKTK